MSEDRSRAKRGRLKLYLGFAAGVGKTTRMLEEAHALRRRGIDVVIACCETHGRAETAALVEGLELVPRLRLEYRGVGVEELDVDAVLARNPQVAVVDDVAHTNAPGCRHRKRHQDVLQLVDAGIDVVCALDVQHLGSLEHLIERTTGVAVRDTVPDTFLRRADQVLTVDLAVEDLLERLSEGKIYPPERIAWARAHAFTPHNLATLRELVLREVAQSVERSAAPAEADVDVRTRAAGGRLMVCMSPGAAAVPTLLRRGSRIAGRLSTEWYVVYVERPGEAPAHDVEKLHEQIALARELGAEVVRLEGHDPIPCLLDFARSHAVGHLIVGRTAEPWWKRALGRDGVSRMIREAHDIDLHVVPDRPGEAS